ncbi:hypothetical protein [Candidatus Nanohalococcus occultus]|uniref:hypothetical protein n=1 Tax=Candidatus Nanohalococcus occultus TaxID=2978047 RepID=UPI0039DFD924
MSEEDIYKQVEENAEPLEDAFSRIMGEEVDMDVDVENQKVYLEPAPKNGDHGKKPDIEEAISESLGAEHRLVYGGFKTGNKDRKHYELERVWR